VIIKQCETSPDEIHIYLWTIVVKSLILFRPSLIEQYLPSVEFNKTYDHSVFGLKILVDIMDE
jgi:hypothetical protein